MRERREIPAELLRGPPAAIVRLVVPHRFRLDGGVLWTLAHGEDGKTLAWERYENEETAMVPLTVGVGSIDGICGIVQRLSETCPDNGETCVRWEPRDVDCGRSAKGPCSAGMHRLA
jgi:hypothetical protein